MKRLIIFTIILIAATVAVTVLYFKNLNAPGQQTTRVLQTIPDDAALVFEMDNDKGFYEIFEGSKLLQALTNKQKMDELDTMRKQLLLDPVFEKFVNDQNIFVSLHPQQNKEIGWLITLSTTSKFDTSAFNKLLNKPYKGMLINAVTIGGKPGYTVYFSSLKKKLFIVNKDHHIFSGSFSEPLITEFARYDESKGKNNFVQMPDGPNSNLLANLYVNYDRLNPLFDQLFSSNKFADIFKSFRLLSATGSLNMNFKSDALMFNGYTYVHKNPISYLNLFMDQQPVVNKLKDIFPSTTAYSSNFSVSDPQKFLGELSKFRVQAGLDKEERDLFDKIKSETGVNLQNEFKQALGSEFAIVTTRFQEKIAIIELRDGMKFKPSMINVSKMVTDDIGQLNHDKIPFFLLGDAFSILKRPYFRIIDNYLILATSMKEIDSYADSYFNHKFMSKIQEYNDFDDLISERSNASFFIDFKNAMQVFKRDMDPSFYEDMENDDSGWKNFYAASYQLTATGKNYYTNLCIRLSAADTTASVKK